MEGTRHTTTPRLKVVSVPLTTVLVGALVALVPHSASAAGSSTSTPAASERVWWGGSEVSAPLPRLATTSPVTTRYRYAVRTSSRAAVNAAYLTKYAPFLSQPTGYVGRPSACQVGSQSAASRAGTLSALNFVSSLGGLAPVRFGVTLNRRAQVTAMLMSANQRLSHYPTRSWRCWTSTGASNAAKANLALSWPRITSGRTISLFMQEPGSANTAVGHRRWLMNPDTAWMGSGATNDSGAITVVGPTAAGRPNPAYVGWPTAGYFPGPLEPSGRCSLSAGNRGTSFARASVTTHRWVNGGWVRVSTRKHRVQTGYARPTLVWQVYGVSRTGTYKVTVSGIKKPGTTRLARHVYVVRMFTPR